jgi:hypothetical protein
MEYNGWKNYETWNVALWIQNDEGLYNIAKEYKSYSDFAHDAVVMGNPQTPDNVAWNDSGLDIVRLDEMIKELSE